MKKRETKPEENPDRLEEIGLIEEEIKEESKLLKAIKRGYIIIISLLLISLIFFSSSVGFHIISLFSGRIVSSPLNADYSFDLKEGGRVVFEKDVFLGLQKIYDENQKHEIKACLLGRKDGRDYLVNSFYIPVIYNQEVYSVTAKICNSETIISMHSHPALHCIFSEQDVISFNAFRKVNPDGIIGLLCGRERMTFFGYD
ncbi:MAG: hypothetical protein NDI94_02775 [Candidatus Woesearchaeota archaeon]|nr:hypothetical protein [Candidatus Woesearchaeota archaeon]